MRAQSVGQEDPLEKEVETHSSVLAWRNPWTEEPSGLHTVHGVTESQMQLGTGQGTEMVVQHCGHTSCDSAVHFKIANFLLHELHLNFFFLKRRR